MANHLTRAATLLTAGLACTGCIAVWQSDHKIVASTGLAVTIDYDPLLLASDDVASTAQSECRKFGRAAVLDHVRNGRTWTKIAEFRCENGPVVLKGSIASLPSAPLAAGTTYRSLPSPFPAATPPAATPQVARLPAVPPATTPRVAAASAEPPKAGNVSIIDAIGPNWGVTRRQIAKAPVAQTKVASARTAGHPTQTPQAHAKPVRSVKAPNLPVANLKGSLVG
ncbi:MAG: hypothetical protein V4559_16260 [Pseudomonadota bacterium]